MAQRFAVKIKDEGGKDIEMAEAVNGRGGEVYDFEFGVDVAVDTATGKITGNRQYVPSTITMPICKATPVIYQKLVEGKKVKEVTVTLFRIHPDNGSEEAFYTYVFEDVAFVSQQPIVVDTTKDEARKIPPLVKIAMVAEKVTQTYLEGNIAFTDEYREKAASAA